VRSSGRERYWLRCYHDETGAVIAITLVNAKWLLDRDGELTVTIPSHVPTKDLALAQTG